MMKKPLTALLLLIGCTAGLHAQTEKVIDLCEKNTSSSYKVYTSAHSISSTATYKFLTSRYTDFNPVLSGKGNVEIHSGGERTFLGTHDNKNYANWPNFSGKVDIYPYREVEANCGFYGIIMPTRGKNYSPEDASPTLNATLAHLRVTLHEGAAIATEKSAAGIRIGELNTEAGSRLYGYYKSTSTATTAYYLIGGSGTDATLAGRIAPIEKNGTPDANQAVGLVKEGKGTYTLTGNDNLISCGVRVNEGMLLVNNDAHEARTKKLTGGTGAARSGAVASAFGKGILGGTGNIGGDVDLYATLQPGCQGEGTLTLANYATGAACHLTVHPEAQLTFSLTDAQHYTSLHLTGSLRRSDMTEGFATSTEPTRVVISLTENHEVKVGDTYTLIQADGGRDNAEAWNLRVVLPERLTWEVKENLGEEGYTLQLTCTALEDGGQGGDEGGGIEDEEDFAYDDDIDISDVTLSTTLPLRQYLEGVNSEKRIGVAVSNWRYNVTSNPSSSLANLIGQHFNLCVAEDEMKPNAIQPSQGYFDFGQGHSLIQFAQQKGMEVRGHTLAWHNQLPEWISADGKKNDKNWTREQLLDILKEHVTRTVKAYGNKVLGWDVVNETLDDDQSGLREHPDGYQLRRQSVWVSVIGESFIDSAFVWARQANPHIKLYLNDYDCEFSHTAKATALFNLARRLKESGVPIDGVGLQCHLKTSSTFSQKQLDSTVKRFASIGLDCIFTEVDVTLAANTTEEKEKQADIYGKITEVFLHNDNCPHMLVWGIADCYSWITGGYPLLFDNNLGQKPAFKAVRSALHDYAARQMVLTGIKNSTTPEGDAVERQRYDVLGRRTDKGSRGLHIVRMSNGTVKKMVNRP